MAVAVSPVVAPTHPHRRSAIVKPNQHTILPFKKQSQKQAPVDEESVRLDDSPQQRPSERRRQRLIPAPSVPRARFPTSPPVARSHLRHQHQRFTTAEVAQLASSAAAGDARAVATLANANRALVHFLAAKYADRGLDKQVSWQSS